MVGWLLEFGDCDGLATIAETARSFINHEWKGILGLCGTV
jgi:hypothetical protein